MTERSVLMVRLPDDVFDELVQRALDMGKGPAALVRELIEEWLRDDRGIVRDPPGVRHRD